MTESASPEVLLVEHIPAHSKAYRDFLCDEDLRITHVDSGRAALGLELTLPDMDGLELVRHVADRRLPTAAIVIASEGTIANAVEVVRAGAADFLDKPVSPERLRVTLRNTLERQRLERLVSDLTEGPGREPYCGFIGGSPCMQAVYRTIDNAAPSRATVFITGESGTGKELCAEAIHQRSPRRRGPFVTLNCAAIPRDLMESEIFGHVKGAFTGAHSQREGAASRADGGTLFLDEVCEMDLGLQSKLLRFIQTASFQKIGGREVENVDVRFVCATNRNPLTEVEKGRFREDLYYRLHVIPVHMPPLRERGDDVIAIARASLLAYAKEEGKLFRGFTPDAERVLRSYAWPGNVRQLQNVLRHIIVINDGDAVTTDMLPPPIGKDRSAPQPLSLREEGPREFPDRGAVPPTTGGGGIRPFRQIEREIIENAIAMCDGSVSRAAASLEISASTIYRKLSAWRSERPD